MVYSEPMSLPSWLESRGRFSPRGLGMAIPSQDLCTLGIKDADCSKGRSFISWEGSGRYEAGDYPLQLRSVEVATQSSHHA